LEALMNPRRTLLVTLTAGALLVGAAGTAGLLAAGGASAAGASAAASTPTPTPSRENGPDRRGVPGPMGGRGWYGGPGGIGGLRGLGGGGRVLHGEFVIGGQNGTTRTVVVQTGTVSAKGDSKITVTSTDGYKVEWVLNDSTRVRTGWSRGAVKDIADGDTVLVQGTKTGDTATAQLVAERPKGAATAAPKNNAPSSSGA
jgi:hypothetical protein